jgi:hypothetical protein
MPLLIGHATSCTVDRSRDQPHFPGSTPTSRPSTVETYGFRARPARVALGTVTADTMHTGHPLDRNAFGSAMLRFSMMYGHEPARDVDHRSPGDDLVSIGAVALCPACSADCRSSTTNGRRSGPVSFAGCGEPGAGDLVALRGSVF